MIGTARLRSPYCFRVRFELGKRFNLDIGAKEAALAVGQDVRLVALGGDELIKSTRQLAIIGRGYRTEAEASEAAHIWRGYAERGFARANLGADFGDRTAGKSVVTEYGLAHFAELFPGIPRVEPWRALLNDEFGTMIFRQRPWPKFARMGPVEIKIGRNPRAVLGAVSAAADLNVCVSQRETLAFNLYSASFSETSTDARFVMLMMALETLIEPELRADTVRQHVDGLIQQTKESGLERGEVSSLIGSLEWLRQQSIGQAGRQLAKRLGPRQYMEEAPWAFFTSCYEMRSRLVHGGVPRPLEGEVGRRAAHLETFVSDLLSGELVDVVDLEALAPQGAV